MGSDRSATMFADILLGAVNVFHAVSDPGLSPGHNPFFPVNPSCSLFPGWIKNHYFNAERSPACRSII
jgi:hypothetical protein